MHGWADVDVVEHRLDDGLLACQGQSFVCPCNAVRMIEDARERCGALPTVQGDVCGLDARLDRRSRGKPLAVADFLLSV